MFFYTGLYCLQKSILYTTLSLAVHVNALALSYMHVVMLDFFIHPFI